MTVVSDGRGSPCGPDGNAVLDPPDGCEPGRCAVVVVVPRLNPVRLDGGDVPAMGGAERRPQVFLADGRPATERVVRADS